MSKFRVGAIVPVKTFSRAKTRLNLSEEKTEQICSIMLESVLSAISQSNVMETHYDEDSYKIHLNTAEKKNATSALILIPRIMLDVDDQADLRLVLTRDLPVSKSLESVFKS